MLIDSNQASTPQTKLTRTFAAANHSKLLRCIYNYKRHFTQIHFQLSSKEVDLATLPGILFLCNQNSVLNPVENKTMNYNNKDEVITEINTELLMISQ